MKKFASYLLVAAVAFCAGGAAEFFFLDRTNPPDNVGFESGVPYFQTLDLDSPEGAVREFLRAWQANDFLTVYLLLASETEFNFHVNWQTGHSATAIPDASAVSEHLTDVDFRDPASFEHSHLDGLGYFEFFVGAARETGNLPISLEPPVSILGRETVETENDRNVVDVKATCKSHPDIVFRTIQSRRGRWRILYLILPDRDPPLTWPVPETGRWLPQPK